MNAFNSYLCSTVHVAHAHRMRGHRRADDSYAIEAMKKKVPQSVGDAFAIIEADLESPWVLGERYSVSDMYLFTLARWLEGDGVNPEQLTRIAVHQMRMSQDPVVSKVLADETVS